MQQQNKQVPQDPVSQILLREIPRIARNAFTYYLGNLLVLLLVTNAVTILFGTTSFPITGFFEIFGLIITIYAGIVWGWTKSKPSKSLSNQYYVLAVLGIVQAGVLYSAAAYQLASAGYWTRQAWSEQACKCTYDNGEVVSVADKSLACSKCSRRLKVSVDIPMCWTRAGNIAIILGVALYAITAVIPGLYGTRWLTYLTWLLLINGLVFSALKFTSQMQSGRFVHLPPHTTGTPTNSPNQQTSLNLRGFPVYLRRGFLSFSDILTALPKLES